MRRADRLYALVEELRAQAPRPVTRATLARRFEVSSRTIERDVLALQHSGVPIWIERGRLGGYAIDRSWSLPPLNFDATEALAVIAALAAAQSMPFAAAGRRAEQKILAAMRHDEALRARELAGRLRVAAPTGTNTQVLAAVEDAVVDRRVVTLEYADRDGQTSTRSVEAHGLHLSPRGAYLVGWCRLRDGGRAFRLDRIQAVEVTDEVAPPREIDPMLDWVDDAFVPAAHGAEAAASAEARTQWHGYAPRRADDRTGSGHAFARAVARSLPGVEEVTHADRPTYEVGGEVFLILQPDEGAFVRLPADEQRALARGRPDVFAIRHGLQVVLSRLGRDELRALIERSWRSLASETQVAAFERVRGSQAPPLTFDDVRAVILALPGVTEQVARADPPVSWFAVDGERHRTFAGFGRASNLLTPDADDVLMIRWCPDRAVLLATQPERFFVTPHYGDPSAPGAVLTRLHDNRAEHLDELHRLLETAWRLQAHDIDDLQTWSRPSTRARGSARVGTAV